MRKAQKMAKRMLAALCIVTFISLLHNSLSQHCDKDSIDCGADPDSKLSHIESKLESRILDLESQDPEIDFLDLESNSQYLDSNSIETSSNDANDSAKRTDYPAAREVISEATVDHVVNKVDDNVNTNSENDDSQKSQIGGYVSNLEQIYEAKIVHPREVKSEREDSVNVGMIIVNTKHTPEFEENFARMTKDELRSIIDNANHHTPIHLIYITDEFSAKQVGKLIGDFFAKKITMNVLTNIWKHKIGMPPVTFSFVDFREIKAQKPEFVDIHRWLNGTGGDDKYDQDFFYIAPLYHLAFTQLEKFIALDVQDLEFHVDISEIWKEFDKMLPENVLSIGLDLSLHYRVMLNNYIAEHPDTKLGKPGRFQGFNCGVVLYNLDRMRNSELYNKYLNKDEVLTLLNKYGFRATLAEQDWMTNLGFSHPELIHILPCTYNAQTSIQYMKNEWVNVFDSYHYCDVWDNLKVIHFNGCGPLPEHCGNDNHQQSKKFRESAYFNVGLKIDWEGIEKMRRGEVQWFWVDEVVEDKLRGDDKHDEHGEHH